MYDAEVSYNPIQSHGPDLHYNDGVTVQGQLEKRELARFSNRRRTQQMGPMVIYYAGVVGPIVAASMSMVSYTSFRSINWPVEWASIASLCLAALAGICWFMIFMRWGSRKKAGRHGELELPTQVSIDRNGVKIERGGICTIIDWSAVIDVTHTRDYIALIVEGANDILLPKSWFENKDAQDDCARKIRALRPPPLFD